MQRSVQDPSLDVWSPTSAQLALISASLTDLEALIENDFVRGSRGPIEETSVPPSTNVFYLHRSSRPLVQIANKHPGGRHQGNQFKNILNGKA